MEFETYVEDLLKKVIESSKVFKREGLIYASGFKDGEAFVCRKILKELRRVK